jgi:hypothetical protein
MPLSLKNLWGCLRDGDDPGLKEGAGAPRHFPKGREVGFAVAFDGDIEGELALIGLDLGEVALEDADRRSLELFFLMFSRFAIWPPRAAAGIADAAV